MDENQKSLPEWRGKYVGVNPLEKLHEDEPYFFMRAQDVTAPAGVEAYANGLNAAAAIAKHESNVQIGEEGVETDALEVLAMRLHNDALDCFAAAEAMRVWQRLNPKLVKLPD